MDVIFTVWTPGMGVRKRRTGEKVLSLLQDEGKTQSGKRESSGV